jgi:alpha-glucosidase (family GH31 glycosyl hydrolase)
MLNPNGRSFWAEEMQPNNFLNTNSRYHFWIDMNEPTVFSADNKTMIGNNLHYDNNGHPWYHKDVHNMYGALTNEATY